ncbi:MAG: DNA mismatch repair endonuclease MutL [Nanobdellota archaeon]
MGSITILEVDLVNKIAAGEVVERPASVVKELIENALDAGADTLTVEVEDGGKSVIRVKDNGKGMDADDLTLSVTSHATSKILSVDDLFSVQTLGFRGEALASIAAVSTLRIISAQEDGRGHEFSVMDGVLKPVGASKGTVVEVSDLFHNTPARKKHLKSTQTELSHISDIVARYALSSEELAIRLFADGREVVNCPKTKLRNKLVSLYGKETARQMIPVSYGDDFVGVTGMVGKPYMTYADRGYQTLFVNGRFVKSQAVNQAIYDAYHTLLFLNRHPVVVLFLEIDFSQTDVNVHPQKEVIRIEDEARLYRSVFQALRKAFEENDLMPEVELSGSQRMPTKQYAMADTRQTVLETDDAYDDSDGGSGGMIAVDTADGTPGGGVEAVGVEGAGDVGGGEHGRQVHVGQRQSLFGHLRILGQLNRLYILCEGDGLVIIDQHAAQERVLFERFMVEFSEQGIRRQELLKPRLFELGSNDSFLLKENLQLLENWGFRIEEDAGYSFKMREVPYLFGREVSFDVLMELIRLQRSDTLTDLAEEVIARRACRAAIKAGDELTRPEIKQLVIDLGLCENPYSCPHGRPTLINISLGELEKKFKRVM